MSNQSLSIDNIAFSKRKEHLSGSLTLADCARLADLLKSQAPDDSNDALQGNHSVNFTLDGDVNAIGQHFLHLKLKADLTTHCQRCLEPMPLALELDFDYLIVSSGENESDIDEAEDNDDYDIQEASTSMDLLALIEDELIMAMPIAPAHEGNCGRSSMQSGEKPNPFAALKGLLKS